MTASLECVTPEATEEIEQTISGRRRFGLLAASSAFIAGLAVLLDSKAAAADCLGSPCCSLATCTWCYYQVSRDRYTCPSGYHRVLWTCTSGGFTWGCGECSGNASTCWQGPFNCSIWFRW
ncbi:hypothetical protein GCM10009765_62590 [Fodinicola feengrottensis]|uniref:Twin-arginine translocation signal domain-containing protein n=1 Tax=Fodinicola feengrottensis TaxID=435914 RepID=A0ABP4UGH3_9ACTN